MSFVIGFATHTVQIWLKQQSPLKWGSLEEARRFGTEADAKRVVASLWLRDVTIQDVGHAGHVIGFPVAKVRLRHNDAIHHFPSVTERTTIDMRLVDRRPGHFAVAGVGSPPPAS